MTSDNARTILGVLEKLEMGRFPHGVANALVEAGYTVDDYQEALDELAEIADTDSPLSDESDIHSLQRAYDIINDGREL